MASHGQIGGGGPAEQASQFQRDDGPVFGLFEVTVSVEVELHGRLHGLDLGRVLAVELLHLGPASLSGSL